VDTLFQHLPDLVSGPLVVVISILLSLVPYLIARKFVARRADEQSKDLANSIIFRISALHGLILAIVFSQEMIASNELRTVAAEEAVLIGDVFHDLRRFDPELTDSTRRYLARYSELVVSEEWQSLSETGMLHDEAWAMWEAAYQDILNLKPVTAREEIVHAQMVERIHDVAGKRRVRENAAAGGVHPLFMTAAIVGIVLISLSYFAFRPTRVNVTLLSIYGAFTGLIVYFIAAFANPYDGPSAIDPIGFDRLLEIDMADYLDGTE
jgi:hypothetical protein